MKNEHYVSFESVDPLVSRSETYFVPTVITIVVIMITSKAPTIIIDRGD